jgi:hypothetical protein
MPLKAGTKSKAPTGIADQYAGSMAEAMEHAFRQEWPVIMGSDAPPANDHMRLLFIAIAQGVVQHLKANEDSITIDVPVNGGNDIDVDISVTSPVY